MPISRKIRCARSGPWREVMQSYYRRVGAVYGRCTYHRGSKYRSSVCVWHAHWKRANSNSRLRRRATTRGASTSGKVTAVFVCRDATQRSEKKEGGKRERERDEEREKQQSKPCRAMAVARVLVHNKNRRCFNVTNIYFLQFLFILFLTATRLIMDSASETWNRENESLLFWLKALIGENYNN